jgi:hypothetical protein
MLPDLTLSHTALGPRSPLRLHVQRPIDMNVDLAQSGRRRLPHGGIMVSVSGNNYHDGVDGDGAG